MVGSGLAAMAGRTAASPVLDDDRGDHSEHALRGLDVGEDVAMPQPRPGIGRLDQHRVPLPGATLSVSIQYGLSSGIPSLATTSPTNWCWCMG